jgi:hypothetical protein
MENVLYLAKQDLCSFSDRDLQTLAKYLHIPPTNRNDLCWKIALQLYKHARTGDQRAQMPSAQKGDEYLDITSITELLPILTELSRENSNVLIGFDWDNTVSLENGCNTPLREGDTTLDFFKQVNDLNIPWFVLTARLRGDSLLEDTYYTEPLYITFDLDDDDTQDFGEWISLPLAPPHTEAPSVNDKKERRKRCVRKFVKGMHKALPPLDNASNIAGLYPTLPQAIETPDYQTIIIYKGIVFAGGGKGIALNKLLDDNVLPNDFDRFVFVDNDRGHVNSVIQAFTERGQREKLLAVHYNQDPLLRCETERHFSISKCLKENIL